MIKELLEEFPLNQDKEIISKFIAGEKLSQREILRAFHMSFPLFTLVVLNKRFDTNHLRGACALGENMNTR